MIRFIRFTFLNTLFILNGFVMEAQLNKDSVAGVYYLQNVMETASVLQLNPDHSFEFFYSYGAVDRNGKGKWETDKDNSEKIRLNSAARPALDFALVNSKDDSGAQFTIIRITDPNKMLLSYVYARIYTAAGVVEKRTDHEGYAVIPKQPITKIELLFELCPDRLSTFVIADSSRNNFEFRFEKWIAEVFFENIVLTRSAKGLTGPHPLLKEGQYFFEKEK